MLLSRYTLKNINSGSVTVPDLSLFELPERVLQFGTGVLLRGLPDYFIDKANRKGIFNGRIVVVKSTSQGDSSFFEKQDGLYTVCVRGLEKGVKVEENTINSAISRVLSATEQWEEVLSCAHNQHLQIIISNTTEVGIQLINEDIRQYPPKSYPAKLLSFLYERYRAFEGSARSGLVIVPTELIPDNGRMLESIILELAHLNGLESAFIEWLELHNCFCNSLVDRIVPGKPDKDALAAIEKELGYIDNLVISSEVYRLWAIEGDAKIRDILSFCQADEGVVIEPDINRFRELKLRMLNGTHTLSCGLAFLSGCQTVKEAMDDEIVGSYITGLMKEEIAPAIPYNLPLAEALEFGSRVEDRFRNPHIKHQWINITVQYSSKMKMRCLPLLVKHYQQRTDVPQLFALGFAAYIYFMKAVVVKDGGYYGEKDGSLYHIQDDQAEVFYKRWMSLSIAGLVREVLSDNLYWGVNLSDYPGFMDAVLERLNNMINNGVKETVEQIVSKKEVAA